MAGNARFHDKLHRKNHHTNPTDGFVDSASDPIASPSEPFQGDFVINGALSSNFGIDVLSANIAEDIYCNNIYVSSVTYTNWISGNSTETIISDGVLTGNGNNTLTLNYQNCIYGIAPLFCISNTLCTLSTIIAPTAKFTTLIVNNLSTSSGKLSVSNDFNINGNLFVSGNLSAMGEVSVIDTNIVTTSALSVTNYGTNPALLVNQKGNYATAIFQNNDTNILIVSGASVNVYGNLSSTGNVYGTNINTLSTSVKSLSNGLSASLAQNGYQYLPSGLIMQWGRTSILLGGDESTTINYPIAFPTSTLNVVATMSGNNTNTSASVQSFTNSTLTLNSDNQSGTVLSSFVFWQAIGY
jgi:hypothetical protein